MPQVWDEVGGVSDDDGERKYRGTGDVIAEVGPFAVYDDGDDDEYVRVRWAESGETVRSELRRRRAEMGDAEFKRWLDAMADEIDVDPDDIDADSFENRPPPAFKCRDCGLTTPRSMRADPDDHGLDPSDDADLICTDCAERR